MLFGMSLTDNIGLFLEGTKASFYGRDEQYVSTGINWKF